jgi:phosphoglycolate phosphatase
LRPILRLPVSSKPGAVWAMCLRWRSSGSSFGVPVTVLGWFMKRKLVIFDFDGTLADSFPWFVSVFDGVAVKYGFKRLDLNNVDALRGLDAREIMRRHQVPFWKVPSIAHHMHMLMKRDIGHIRVFPGISDALRELEDKGAILAVVTSNSHANVVRVLGPQNATRFSHFECGASLFGKAARLRNVLAAAKVSPDNAILIGDEIRDARAAAQASIAFGAVAWGFNRVDALISNGAREVFTNVEELVPKLFALMDA